MPRIVEGDGAPLDRRHVLVGVEAVDREDGARVGADAAAGVARPHRVGGVLDDREAVLLRDLPDPLHPARQAAVVDRDDRLRPRRDPLLDPLGVEVHRVGLDVDEDRDGPSEDDVRDRADERVRGRDHLVARADAEGSERHLEAGRGVQEGEAVGHLVEGLQRFLEARRLRPRRQPAGAEGVDDLGDLLLADHRAGEGEEGLAARTVLHARTLPRPGCGRERDGRASRAKPGWRPDGPGTARPG